MANALANIDEHLHHLFLPQLEALEMTPQAQRNGVLSHLASTKGHGSAWMTGIGSHCLITVLDLSIHEPIELTSASPGYLCVGSMSRSSMDTMPLPVLCTTPSGLIMYRQCAGTYPYQLQSHTPYTSRSICFTPHFLEQLAREYCTDTDHFFAKLTEEPQLAIAPHLERMLNRLDPRKANAPATAFHLGSLVSETIGCLIEMIDGEEAARCTQGTKQAAELVEKAHTLMLQNLDKPLTLEKMARELCVSRAHLAALYKKETGRGVAEEFRHLRMSEAARLITETERPLSEIGRAVGYTRPSSFADAFKRHYGCSPLQWRDRL